jgi:hypothetical protein
MKINGLPSHIGPACKAFKNPREYQNSSKYLVFPVLSKPLSSEFLEIKTDEARQRENKNCVESRAPRCKLHLIEEVEQIKHIFSQPIFELSECFKEMFFDGLLLFNSGLDACVMGYKL